MNNRKKGNYHEKRVANYLKSQGYQVERTFGKPIWRYGTGLIFCARDLFGAFDILAIKEPNEIRFIQVTSGAVSRRKKNSFKVWSKSEVWEHIRAGIYRIHYSDRTEVIDINKQFKQFIDKDGKEG